MSEYGYVDLLELTVFGVIFTVFFLPLTLGLEAVVGAELVYGGTNCHATGEIMACTGVLPAGLAISCFISLFLALGINQRLKTRLEVAQ